MTIILFLAILALLILSHELGHFLVAKKLGIRVDEFGLGFPPAIARWRRGETVYSLNLLPFGGFVKIFGENPDEESLQGPDSGRSLVNKPRWAQALVLLGGVTFNWLLAWFLIALGFWWGLPVPASQVEGLRSATPPRVLVTAVLPDSPAAAAGLKAGDALVGLVGPDGGTLEGVALNVESVQNFVRASAGAPLSVRYQRGAIFKDADLPVASVTVTPTITADAPPAIGVGLDQVVIARAGPLGALWRSLRLTADLTVATAEAIFNFIFDAFRGQGSLSDVTGPVGLVGLVGDARTLGFVYLLSFTALISINLAIVNLIPFPALDGGRLLFLLIEKIKGSPLKPAVANWANILGFILLLGLMAIITASDLTKLF